MTKDNRVYRDKQTGQYKILERATKLSSLTVGDNTAVRNEVVIPQAQYAFRPSRPIVPSYANKESLAYFYFNSVIFHAVAAGKPESEQVTYKRLWPVLQEDYTGNLESLTNRILSASITVNDTVIMNKYLVRGDSFFVFKGRAWWADRFRLRSGLLRDGKNFRGTASVVSGVPKDQDPNGNYNHIVRVHISENGSKYRMLTEERRMRLGNVGQALWNYRAVINEYESADLENWVFVKTIKENSTIDSRDYTKRPVLTQQWDISIPPRLVRPRTLKHFFNTQETNLSNKVSFIEPAPGAIMIRKAGEKFRAWMNYGTMKFTFVSKDGITWWVESTGSVSTRNGTDAYLTKLIYPEKK